MYVVKLATAFFTFTCRFAKPSDISGAVAFLVSDDASYMTGETMVALQDCRDLNIKGTSS